MDIESNPRTKCEDGYCDYMGLTRKSFLEAIRELKGEEVHAKCLAKLEEGIPFSLLEVLENVLKEIHPNVDTQLILCECVRVANHAGTSTLDDAIVISPQLDLLD